MSAKASAVVELHSAIAPVKLLAVFAYITSAVQSPTRTSELYDIDSGTIPSRLSEVSSEAFTNAEQKR